MRSLRLTGTLQVRGSEKLQRTYVRGQGLPAQWRPVRPKGFLGSVLVRRRGLGQRRWLSGEPPLGITSAYITNADRANADGANDDAIVHQRGWR
jgi:hypothetical protein